LFAAPAVAQTAPQAQPVQTNPTKSDVNKVVCERQDEIGSRLSSKKVCMTVQEWQEYRAEHRENVERWQQSAQARPSGD